MEKVMAVAKNVFQISFFMNEYSAVAVNRADKGLSVALIAAARVRGWKIGTAAKGRFIVAFAPIHQAAVCAA